MISHFGVEKVQSLPKDPETGRGLRFARRLVPIIVIAALLIPSIPWILRDQKVWFWDLGHYGDGSIRLWNELGRGLTPWLGALGHALELKPPLIVWIGQFFVPLRYLTGEVESALLLSNILVGAFTLWLVYLTSRKIGCDRHCAVLSILVCGGSGAFIGLSHIYLAEIFHCCSVALLTHLTCRLDRCSAVEGLSSLAAAAGLCFLSKASSMVFVAPMIGYSAIALALRSRPQTKLRLTLRDILTTAVAILAFAVTVWWYTVNWQAVLLHFRFSVSDTAAFWGSFAPFHSKMFFWSLSLSTAVSPFPVVTGGAAALVTAMLIYSLWGSFRFPIQSWVTRIIEDGTLFAVTLAGMIILVVLTYSLQINEERRLILPIVPAAAVLIAWSVSATGMRLVAVVGLLLFVLNASVHHSIALGGRWSYGVAFYLVHPPHRESDKKERLAAIVRATCQAGNENGWNVFIVNYLALNGNAATFYSGKAALRNEPYCNYTNLSIFGSNVDEAMTELDVLRPRYIITVAAEHQMRPNAMNVVARGVTELLATNSRFRVWTSIGDVVIYEMTPPVRAR